jgi:phosphodiesterase/alkaline phosphatase D-like protein
MRVLRLHRLPLPIVILVVTGTLHFTNAAIAQAGGYTPKILPPAKAASHVYITQGPAIESVTDELAIIRWTSNNPGGSDEHFGIVRYGTDPQHLSETAKSHIRLNQNHSYTVFRVRVDGLMPRSTYYYKVDSMQGNGRVDGVKSPLRHFTTP